jgi:NAD(P)-dependent dehydrogenase (short-subunit alcohol dehydrogenase family)
MSSLPRSSLITGAGGGLGSAIARRFAAAGHPVVCLDQDKAAALRTVAALGSAGSEATAYGLDVTDESAVVRLRESLGERDRLPCHVINAAGILPRGQMADTGAAGFRHVMDVNVTGAYSVIRTFAADLVRSGAGRVLNIGSIAGTIGYPFPAYAASKAALINLTRALVLEFWGTGVTANAVCPGAMDTPMLDRSATAVFLRKTPTRRIVSPGEVAALCAYLISEDAAGINGQSIVIDGGATSVFRYTDEERS